MSYLQGVAVRPGIRIGHGLFGLKRVLVGIMLLASFWALSIIFNNAYSHSSLSSVATVTKTSLSSVHKPAMTLHTVTQSTSSPTIPIKNGVAAPTPCTPSAYALPSALSLDQQPAGLTQIIDPVTTYQIYGNTAAQIRGQIQQCAPKPDGSTGSAEYTGQTGYEATWLFTYTSNADGTCSISNAKIGMHVGITAPTWQASSAVSPTLREQMASFLPALITHEQGHVALSEQYANRMLNDLQHISPTNCSTVQSTVNAMMQSDVTALNTANAAYDASTNHGATQGAVLPS